MNQWREWSIAFGILVVAWIISALSRAALRRALAAPRSADPSRVSPVAELIPNLTRLIYVVGLYAFLEFAPLHPRVGLWLEAGTYVFAVMILLTLARRGAMLAIEWSVLRTANSATLQQGFIPLMRNVITLFVLFAGAIMILQHFHYDVLSLLTALGVGSLAVGLAAKDTLSNMISGFTLIIDRNLRPGDRINLSGSIGDVQEIGLRSTRLMMPDGNTLIVPNSELVNTKIINFSMPGRETTTSTQIRVPVKVPFSRIRDLCLAVSAECPLIRRDPKPGVTLTSLYDGHQLVTIGFWVGDMNDTGPAASQFNEKILERLSQEGIEIVGPAVK